MASTEAVANYFLQKSFETGVPLTPMKLIKLVYIAHGWHLVTPTSWQWLSDNELQSIDKMLFSSAFGGVVLAYLKDVMIQKSDGS